MAVFDKDFETTKVWSEASVDDGLEAKGNHVGAIIGFSTQKGEKINAKVASSFISIEQAELNLTQEVGDKTFQENLYRG